MDSREALKRTNGDKQYRQRFEEFTIKRTEKWSWDGTECGVKEHNAICLYADRNFDATLN